jgi:hypothetical protein
MKITVAKNHSYFTGFRPRIAFRSFKALPQYLRSIRLYKKLNTHKEFDPKWSEVFPILTERGDGAGTAGGHYFHQDLWAAQKIFERRPTAHIDIGSRLDGFVAHLLVFMPVTTVDIRPLHSEIAGLTFLRDDATKLQRLGDGTVQSLSSLHVAEHFGLGRYSDPIDPEACFSFMSALERVLAPEGILYFSVPVGRERVEFNAHRIFSPATILRQFASLELLSFSFVGDDDKLYTNCDAAMTNSCEYACGLFEFTKPAKITNRSESAANGVGVAP